MCSLIWNLEKKVYKCNVGLTTDHQRDQLILRTLQRSDFRRRPKVDERYDFPSPETGHIDISGLLVHNGRERLRKAAATTHGRMQHRRRERQAGRLRGGRMQEVQNGPKCIELIVSGFSLQNSGYPSRSIRMQSCSRKDWHCESINNQLM